MNVIQHLIKLRRKSTNFCVTNLLLVLSFIFLTTIPANAQTGNVNLKLKNVTLPRLFQEIEKQSTYRFSYRDADLVGKAPVTVSVKERSLKSVLTDILSKRNLQYQVSGNKILITVSSVQTPKSTGKKEVSGVVVDERGEPVIGVNISEKGTTNGTITDMDGRFSFKVGNNSSLLVSYIGYDGQEISVRGKNQFNITLKENSQALDEVVVIGYGTQSRELLTTSVSKVDNKVLESVPYGNLASALQGSVSGVRVQSTSGQPGEAPRIVVRGGTSIQNPDGAAPLYVVDGITRDDINHLSSNDIESIQVLKDAASTSIYGAKGSNGVVIVTTKSAKAGKASVSYSYDFTISTIGKKYKMANAKDYLTMHRTGMIMQDKFPDASSELGMAHGYGTGNDLTNQTAFTTQYLNDSNRHKLNEGWQSMPDPVDPSKTLIFQDNKTSDLAYRTGFSHNHHAEVSGSSERAKFLAGIGYLKKRRYIACNGL